MKSRLAVTLCALFTALCLSAALRAVADTQGTHDTHDTQIEAPADPLRQRQEQARASEQQIESSRIAWQGEYRSLLSDYQVADEDAAEAARAWRSGRKRHRLRGDTKVAARDAIDRAQRELAAATEAIRGFHERARLEGTPPGWLFAVEEEFPLIASAVSY